LCPVTHHPRCAGQLHSPEERRVPMDWSEKYWIKVVEKTETHVQYTFSARLAVFKEIKGRNVYALTSQITRTI